VRVLAVDDAERREEVGDKIQQKERDFALLSKAFFAEIERKLGA